MSQSVGVGKSGGYDVKTPIAEEVGANDLVSRWMVALGIHS